MTYIELLISKFHSKGIVVDTNILILLFVGLYNKELIDKWKRTQKYIKKDFEFLINFLSNFIVITTPNILTETFNLTEKLNNETSYQLFEECKIMIGRLNEVYIPSVNAIKNKSFIQFGLSDSTIIDLSDKGFLILTDDYPLYGYLLTKGKFVINFSHLRTEYIM
jgi:hypothetical protein